MLARVKDGTYLDDMDGTMRVVARSLAPTLVDIGGGSRLFWKGVDNVNRKFVGHADTLFHTQRRATAQLTT